MKAMLISVAAVTACVQFGCSFNPNANSRGVEDAESEEQGPNLAIEATHDSVRAGVRLVLKYDQRSESFGGMVENVTEESIAAVGVEVHLSDGTELGPTPREGLEPRQKRAVTLSAAGHTFETWKAHAESGEGGEHGHGSEGEREHGRRRDGEHSESGEHR